MNNTQERAHYAGHAVLMKRNGEDRAYSPENWQLGDLQSHHHSTFVAQSYSPLSPEALVSPNFAPKCTKAGCLEQVTNNTNYLRLVLQKSELKTDPVLLICDSGEATMNKHLALSAESRWSMLVNLLIKTTYYVLAN